MDGRVGEVYFLECGGEGRRVSKEMKRCGERAEPEEFDEF